MRNFFSLYRPLATTWRLYDSAHEAFPILVAKGGRTSESRIYDESTWRSVEREADERGF